MVAYAGRQVTFTWNGETIPGVREKGVTLDGAAIDIGSDEDQGWRTSLANIAQENKIDVALSGVTKSNVLRAAWLTGQRTGAVAIAYPNGDSLAFTANLVNYDEKNPHRDAITFDAKLESSGAPTTSFA